MKCEQTMSALKILRDFTNSKGMCARDFARELWKDDPTKQHLFNTSTNTGNGACRGKKAWICGGSFLGRLRRKGLVSVDLDTGEKRYFITELGNKFLKDK